MRNRSRRAARGTRTRNRSRNYSPELLPKTRSIRRKLLESRCRGAAGRPGLRAARLGLARWSCSWPSAPLCPAGSSRRVGAARATLTARRTGPAAALAGSRSPARPATIGPGRSPRPGRPPDGADQGFDLAPDDRIAGALERTVLDDVFGHIALVHLDESHVEDRAGFEQIREIALLPGPVPPAGGGQCREKHEISRHRPTLSGRSEDDRAAKIEFVGHRGTWDSGMM